MRGLRALGRAATISAALKALLRALWAPVLLCLAACASASGQGANTDEPERAVTEPIIGGYLDTTTKGVVALAHKLHDQGHEQVLVFCSGSLLAPNLVLTARHCTTRIGDGSSESVDCAASEFTSRDPLPIFVSADSKPQSTSQLFAVKEIREAPGSSKVCGYDMALLVLSSAVPGSVATPIEPVLSDPTLVKAKFAAVGYGVQDPKDATSGATAGSRMRFDMSSVFCVGGKCPFQYSDTSLDEFVGKSPVCSGDSGGPALDSKGRVFGVTSRGDTDCTFALYSNVASWADFLQSTALDAATSGGYAPLPWATADTSTVEPGAAGSGGTGASGNAGAGQTASGGSSAGEAGASPQAAPPLGAACTASSECELSYSCYSASSTPPGICVPSCRADGASCPASYACNADLGVCTPTQSLVNKSRVSASCSLGARSLPAGGPWAALLAASVVRLGRRRRKP